MKKYTLLILLLSLNLIFSSCNSEKDMLITLSTQFGDIKLVLFDDTPKHKENFIKLVQNGTYDKTIFHRVINGFMIQGGDPYTKDPNQDSRLYGTGGVGYTIPAEIVSTHPHKRGSLAAARQGDHVNPNRESSGSQFYIVQHDNGARHLDGQYTVFGQVVDGFDVIDKIAAVKTTYPDRPVEPITVSFSMEEISKEKITERYGYQYPKVEEKK